jgi:hypothetical protein
MLKKVYKSIDSKAIRIIVIVIGILLIFFGYEILNAATAEKQNLLDPLRGQITPKIDPSKPILVVLGGSLGNYSTQELAQGIDLTRLVHIQTGNDTVQFPIQITFRNDNIQVSATIRDEKGNLLADIKDNEWKAVSSDSMNIWDKNYNSFAFEVIEINKFPILQVLVAKENEIRIGFNLYSQNISFAATVRPSIFIGLTSTNEQSLRNDTVFKYPSKTHLGEMNPIYLVPDLSPNATTDNNSQKTYVDNPLTPSINRQWIGGSMIVIGGCIDAFVGLKTVTKKRKKVTQIRHSIK